MKKYNFIVIGGGPGGITCARFAKSLKPDWKVALVRKQEKSVIPCAMPYALDETIKIEDYIKSDKKLLIDMNIDLFIEEVISINPQKNEITLEGGDVFSFDYLAIATGSEAFVPPIKGANLKNVFTIKDHPDILAVKETLKNVKKAVVVGAGFIGLEMVNAFSNIGIEVSLIEKEPACLPNAISKDFSSLIENDLKQKGIKLYLGKTLKEIVGKDKAEFCLLESGEKVKADIVILSIGVKPYTELAQKSGIEVDKYGIIVDDYLCTNFKNIYAFGDCIKKKSFITGEILPGYLATNAVVEARYVVFNMLGYNKKFPGIINPAITKVFDYSCGVAGFSKDLAEKLNLEFVDGDVEIFSKEKSFPGAVPLKVRLLFDKKTLTLIGGEAISKDNVSWIINNIALAILNKNTAWDLALLQFVGHPPQIDVPSKMPFVLCAISALKKSKVLKNDF